MRTCGIYKITSPSGKIYIGQSVDIKKRIKSHAWKSKDIRACPKLSCSISKYGLDAHSTEIVHVCDKNELDAWEIFYIAWYDTFDTPHGLNLTPGGCNPKLTETIKTKLKGRKRTPQQLAKRKGGWKLSIEQKERQRQRMKGQKLPCSGERITSTTVYCKDPDGLVLRFTCMKDCQAIIGLNRNSMRLAIKNKLPSKGYYFSYTNDFTQHREKSKRIYANTHLLYVKDVHGQATTYLGIGEASRQLKMSRTTIKDRIRTRKLYKNKYYFSLKPF